MATSEKQRASPHNGAVNGKLFDHPPPRFCAAFEANVRQYAALAVMVMLLDTSSSQRSAGWVTTS